MPHPGRDPVVYFDVVAKEVMFDIYILMQTGDGYSLVCTKCQNSTACDK